MFFLPSRYATKNKCAWKHVISAVGECLLEGNHGKIQEVRKKVEAEKYGGQIGRQEHMDEVGNGMIVVCN